MRGVLWLVPYGGLAVAGFRPGIGVLWALLYGWFLFRFDGPDVTFSPGCQNGGGPCLLPCCVSDVCDVSFSSGCHMGGGKGLVPQSVLNGCELSLSRALWV
eukprot:8721057-Pyramimonas_sp.AAC.1